MSNNGAAEVRSVVSPVEEAIKDGISEYKVKKEKLKELRTQLEEALMQDDKYSNAKTVISETSKIRKEAREKLLLEDSDLQELDEQIKTLAKDMKDEQLSLFDYLLDFNKTTGKKIITDHAGESYPITVAATIEI